MNIQNTIQILALLTFSCTQCMELVQPKTNNNIDQTTLKLDNSVINKLIDSSKKNKSNPLLLSQRTKKIHLLQKLLNKKANITFSNDNKDIKFWLNRDEEIVKKILYDKLLSFVSYRTCQNKITINHTPLDQQKPFSATFQYSTSLLHITFAQPLTRRTKNTVIKLLHEYLPNNEKKVIKKPLIKDQQQQATVLCTQEQDTITIEKQKLTLTEEDFSLFATLPDNTQELLREIILDLDNLGQ